MLTCPLKPHLHSFFPCFMPAESSILEGLALLWDTSFLMALIILVNITVLVMKISIINYGWNIKMTQKTWVYATYTAL